ncbi:group II intron maturase-specific domain-containing protein [Pseudomonas syringae]|uniref:group II intron maturase-specific domain-containing protein n=1 Tax=Pseudomonas syringae TaxID=317 RepID=UPI0031FF216E
MVAKKVFNQVDSEVRIMLWRWAVRRHPRKGTPWVKDRYFKVRGSRRWVFTTFEKSADGKVRGAHLTERVGYADSCAFHTIRPPSPPTFGHLFHAHPARQSERSDAGLQR